MSPWKLLGQAWSSEEEDEEGDGREEDYDQDEEEFDLDEGVRARLKDPKDQRPPVHPKALRHLFFRVRPIHGFPFPWEPRGARRVGHGVLACALAFPMSGLRWRRRRRVLRDGHQTGIPMPAAMLLHCRSRQPLGATPRKRCCRNVFSFAACFDSQQWWRPRGGSPVQFFWLCWLHSLCRALSGLSVVLRSSCRRPVS